MKNCLIVCIFPILFGVCLSISNRENKVFKIALLIPWNITYDFSGYTSASAVAIAIKVLERESFFRDNISLTFLTRDDNCRSKEALGNAADLLINESVDVFIGPPCSSACRAVAELASVFEVPMISWVGTDPDFDDKSTYSTLARTLGPFSKMGTFLLEIFQFYNWKRVVVISSTDLLYQDAANAIRKVFGTGNLTISFSTQYDYLATDSYIKSTLTKTKLQGRIILVITSDEETRRFLLAASELGMTSGDYVFFTVNVLPVDNLTSDVDIWRGNDGKDEEAKRAFECVFHVTLAALSSEDVVKFREEVARRMQDGDWKRHALPGYSDDVTSAVAMGDRLSPFLYDSVLLYALALKETMNRGQNVSNGTEVAMNFRGQFFQGMSGNVIIDSNGDREPDYWILDLNPETWKFEKIAEVVNLKGGRRVSVDIENEFHKDIKLPSWPGGKVGHQYAPLDTPVCGFADELCQGIMPMWLLALVGILIMILTAGTFATIFCLLRKSKFESKLLMQSWKIKYSDIEMVGSKKDPKPKKDCASPGSGHSNSTEEEVLGSNSLNSYTTRSSACLKSISSLGTLQQQIFSDVGYHRGVLVAIKHIRKEHIQISRTILLEFNQLKDIAHNNLNVFVGACVDPPNICLVWHYCPKGSIQDIVMNDEIKLDMTFKLSFLMDISKGMHFLHKSHLHSHGNLKSSNCLVDARWNVRITDYGLPSFLSGQYFDESEQDMYRRKLWMAPELLRENTPPPCGTQKGDVYSFAIIAFEIIMRSEPYPLDLMTAKDVTNRVRNGESIPFRPYILDSCDVDKPILDLIRAAWHEDPEHRPNFVQIRTIIKKQANGEINIMDNVLSLMERYAYNLEEIVEERTQQLMEEKKKTDRLLYRMLPSTVAEQLKLGRPVKPETYDQSTIYFSDIVGFLTLASQSTPLQIVDFLNDLYSYFDEVISKHDVYKVETIGDSYMVVSGVPVRNGQRHAAEIANMSLDLLSSVLTFRIKHRPNQRIQLRIGLHTGPVVAGVVGLTMPRYCLFGDTVNMTARMESSGKGLHIHLSKQCFIALSEIGGYEMTLRGEMNVKGKGLQTTYWLNGKRGYDKPLPEMNDS